MSTRSIIASQELDNQVRNSFVNQAFEVALIDAPGQVYTPGVTDNVAFLSNEVTAGQGGYERQVITYSESDIANYSDGGVALTTKGAVFQHDLSSTTYQFSQVVLMRGQGNLQTLGGISTKPSTGTNGEYLAIPVNNVGTGTGYGLTVNLIVTGNGVAQSDWQLEINDPGYGYGAGDALVISNSVLTEAGATSTGTGELGLLVGDVSTGDGAFVSVTPTSSTITMVNGNEAVFYFNIKQFGFASQA